MDKIKQLQVHYEGRTVGTVALYRKHLAAFQYSEEWIADGFSISPFSLPLGFLITLCANCRFRPVKWIAQAYIFVMRGTPLMLQLFFFYFGLPFIPGIGQYLRMSSFTAAVLSFTLNYAAYFAEIFRGGLLSIDKGQYEVSHVLGLNSWQTMTRVIIPQMIRVTLPSIGNEAITLVKDTALVASIALPELLHYAKGSTDIPS